MIRYNKSVIDWFLEQQLFCLTRGLNCCPKDPRTELLPEAASGNSSVLGSNKTAVVLRPSQ
jgi:hypothetical protein